MSRSVSSLITVLALAALVAPVASGTFGGKWPVLPSSRHRSASARYYAVITATTAAETTTATVYPWLDAVRPHVQWNATRTVTIVGRSIWTLPAAEAEDTAAQLVRFITEAIPADKRARSSVLVHAPTDGATNQAPGVTALLTAVRSAGLAVKLADPDRDTQAALLRVAVRDRIPGSTPASSSRAAMVIGISEAHASVAIAEAPAIPLPGLAEARDSLLRQHVLASDLMQTAETPCLATGQTESVVIDGQLYSIVGTATAGGGSACVAEISSKVLTGLRLPKAPQSSAATPPLAVVVVDAASSDSWQLPASVDLRSADAASAARSWAELYAIAVIRAVVPAETETVTLLPVRTDEGKLVPLTWTAGAAKQMRDDSPSSLPMPLFASAVAVTMAAGLAVAVLALIHNAKAPARCPRPTRMGKMPLVRVTTPAAAAAATDGEEPLLQEMNHL